MAVYSMTGYASALADAPSTGPGAKGAATSLSVEIRSVNGRFLDLSFKLPDELRALEPALRDLVAAGVRRGKVEVRAAVRREADTTRLSTDPARLQALARAQADVLQSLPEARPLSVHEVLQLSRGSEAEERLDETALAAARRCVQGLRESRQREGAKLVEALAERISQLRTLAAQAEPLVPAVVQRQQARFLERWREALAAAGASAPGGAVGVSAEAAQERALSEAAAMAIRIDVAEELSRLRAHLDEIERLLKAGGELGKRLDFLIQELHREANTLGSKSAALELTGISVEMKVLIEQMREQVQNIE